MKKITIPLALACGAIASPVHAQDANPVLVSDTSTTDVIEVTALRRVQNPQDVAVALNVFSGAEIIEQGVKTINALENIAPSLEIESQFGGGQTSFSIRGVGFRDYATLNAPTVGIYVDDVAYPVPVMTQGLLFDLERVEILRGPQGTLYGRNTTGGAIKFVSAAPTSAFSSGLTIEAGRFGRIDAEGFISGPVSQRIRFRLSGATAHGGDWQINRETGVEIGSVEKYALRGQVEIDVAEKIEATFNLHGFIDQSDGLGLQLFNDSVFGPLAHSSRRQTSFGSSQEFADLVGIATDQHPFRDNEAWGANWTINGAAGSTDLLYIGSFETLNRKEFNDWDALSIGGAGVFFQSSADVSSHELRATSTADSRFRYVAGLYYADEDLNEIYQSDFIASFGDGFAVTTPYRQDVRTLAAYLHGDFDLTRFITLTGGLRFEDEERKLRDLGTFATGFGALNFANGSTDGTLENRDLNSDSVSGKAGIGYKPTNDALLYASFSHGVKSGGFTAYNTLNPQAVDPFTTEKLNAFEIGFKTNSANNTVQLNAAAFYYDYKNQQIQSAIFDEGTGAIVGRIVNAPESEIYGGELELLWQAAPWLNIGQSVGYKNGEFKQFTDLDTSATGANGVAVFVDRAGQRLGFPSVSYQGFAEIERDIRGALQIRFRADYSFRDDLALPLLGDAYRVDGYWLANAQFAVGPDHGAWELTFWGRNIFNTDYDETRNFFIAPGGVADIAAPGMPATYGVRINLQY